VVNDMWRVQILNCFMILGTMVGVLGAGLALVGAVGADKIVDETLQVITVFELGPFSSAPLLFPLIFSSLLDV